MRGSFRKVVLLLVHGLGIGASSAGPDRPSGAQTLGHLAAYMGGLRLPFLQWLGLGNLLEAQGLVAATPPAASVAVMGHISSSSSTDVIVREMMGSSLAAMVTQGLDVFAMGDVAALFDDNETTARVSDLDLDCLGVRVGKAAQSVEQGVVLAGTALPWAGGPVGCARALQRLDTQLPVLLDRLGDDALLLVAGTSGGDVVLGSGDLNGEDVPLLAYTRAVDSGVDLGRTETVGSVGATIAENFGVGGPSACSSFYAPILV